MLSHRSQLSFASPLRLGLALGFVGLGLGGCTLSAEEQAPVLGEQSQPFRECPEDTCGSNSPRIENFDFHELNVLGRANLQGMRIAAAELDSSSAKLVVDRARLYAQTKRGTQSGAALVGLVIHVEIPNGDGGAIGYALELVGYREMTYPVPAGAKDALGAYVIEYVDSRGERRNLCGARGSQDLPPDEGYGQRAIEAIFFEGDRINTERMTIAPAVELSWFNIGCAGHTLAKLHLTRNTTAANAAHYGHGLGERQATLKMFVADYCGTGKPFTVAGQPLSWHDRSGVMELYGTPTTLEARWDADGAACIGEPRMEYPATQEGDDRYPDIYTAIHDECPDLLKLKRCTLTDLHDFDGEALVSANRVF